MILDAGTHFAFAGLIREFFGAIDNIVYWLFVNIYNLFIDIANLKLFSDSTLQTFGQRIYVLLGIVMLFRISFSIVGYIVDPDKLTDSKAGFGSLIKNVVISLVLIVTVPIIFRYSRLLQEALLKDNTIPRIITGKQKDTYTEKSLGDELALDILSTFVYPNQNLFPGCNANTILGVTDEDGNFQEKTGPCYTAKEYVSSDGTSYTYQFLDVKDGAIVNPEGVKHPEANMNIEYYEIYESVSKAKGNNNARRKSYSDLLALAEKTNLITSQSNINGSNQYWISYQYIISTIGIAVIAYIFLLFCIDIAVRTVKLAFLQLYAPIPIVMYIDPKSKSKFDEWVKMCVSTYLDLFVRLASIFFALEMIRLLASESALVTSGNSLLVKFFIILGCLMFAKQLPKILEQLLGIKTPDFTLNPVKKLTGVPFAGAVLGAGLGALDARMNGATGIEAWEAAKRGAKIVGLGGSEKKFDDLTPLRKKMLDDKTKGITDFEKIDAQWVKGAKAKKKLDALGAGTNGNTGFKRLDGYDHTAYDAVYKNSEFIDSIMNRDKQDAINKAYTNMLYEAQTMGSNWQGGDLIDVNGNKILDDNGNAIHYDISKLADLKSDAEKSQKKMSGLEKVHETMRNKYQGDAAVEDAIKTNKYNPDNPTGRTHPGL